VTNLQAEQFNWIDVNTEFRESLSSLFSRSNPDWWFRRTNPNSSQNSNVATQSSSTRASAHPVTQFRNSKNGLKLRLRVKSVQTVEIRGLKLKTVHGPHWEGKWKKCLRAASRRSKSRDVAYYAKSIQKGLNLNSNWHWNEEKQPLNMLKLSLNCIFPSYGRGRGPHKYLSRAACLRPLALILVSFK